MNKQMTLIEKQGLLGVVSFLSYTAAVLFAPRAYPGYNWMAQAVSDLSAANSPSRAFLEPTFLVICVVRDRLHYDGLCLCSR